MSNPGDKFLFIHTDHAREIYPKRNNIAGHGYRWKGWGQPNTAHPPPTNPTTTLPGVTLLLQKKDITFMLNKITKVIIL